MTNILKKTGKIFTIAVLTIGLGGCDFNLDSLFGVGNDTTEQTSTPTTTHEGTPQETAGPDDNTDPSNNDIDTVVDQMYDNYDHIPTGSALTTAMAYKFLNMATFGATPELAETLKRKGVVQWVDEQLNMSYDPQSESILRNVMEIALQIDRVSYIKRKTHFDRKVYPKDITVDQFLDPTNSYCFNQGIGNGPNELYLHSAKLFDLQMRSPKQLLQRTAYALSQIVIASESNDEFFRERGEALSHYYDILQKDAFGSYKDLLYDISMSPAMATYLTYAGNEKEHDENGVRVLPDENYGREIMQLFSIGLYRLNMDGTEARGTDGKRVPTYEQSDVNEMSRVFTGLTYRYTKDFHEPLFQGDSTHSLRCAQKFHDTGEKQILGQTVPSGGSCQQDVKAAIDILMQHPNTAPYLAKKLILRLTKSNPKADYVRRVATVFKNSGGSLKATIKAILLDPEIWENIQENKGVKIKEPYLAYTNLLRALGAHPVPYKKFMGTGKKFYKITGERFYTGILYDYFGQWPTYSPSVFNFYDDDFVPDTYEFKVRGFVAPELEILTAKYAVNTNNNVLEIITSNALQAKYNAKTNKRISPDHDGATDPMVRSDNPFGARGVFLYFDYKESMAIFRRFMGNKLNKKPTDSEAMAAAIVDHLSQKLLGRKLPETIRDMIIQEHKGDYLPNGFYTYSDLKKEYHLTRYWVAPIAMAIYQTDAFMVQ